jgi:rubrerythrin
MTETPAIYQAGQVVTYWHCHRCKHVLGSIVDGKCSPARPVVLSYDRPAVIVCPVCGAQEAWYNKWDRPADLQD